MIYFWIALTVVWIVSDVLAWGFLQGAYQAAEYNWCRTPTGFFIATAWTGPALLFVVLVTEDEKHWAWKPLTRQERFAIHQSKYAILGCTLEDFDRKK